MMEKCFLFWFSGQPCKILPTLLLTTLVTCLGSSMLYGYNMAVLNNLELNVKDFFLKIACSINLQNCTSESIQKHAEFQYALLTSAYIISGALGCFCSGPISDKFGRRNMLIVNNIIGIVGGGCSLLVMWTDSILNIFMGRLILGLNAGITTGIAPLFLAEISPTIIRGALIAGHQLSITLGIALAYFITMKFTLNSFDTWIGSLGLPMVPCALSFALLLGVPESPRHLLISRNNDVAAINSCFRYNQIQSTSEQLQEMRKEAELKFESKLFKCWHLFTKKEYRISILVSLAVNAMQQFSGINAIIGYSKSILLDAHISESSTEYCVLAIGIVNFLMTIIAIPLVEKSGRRKLLIYPTLICILSLFGVFLTIGIIPHYLAPQNRILPFFSIGLINIFVICFALGMGPIPCVIVAELFTQIPRAIAYSICLGVQWSCSFLILLFYPIINGYLPPGYVFLLFAGLTSLFLLFLIIYMPETKNQSFSEIATKLQGKNERIAKLTSLF